MRSPRTTPESFMAEVRAQIERANDPYIASAMVYSGPEGRISTVVKDILSETPRVSFHVTSRKDKAADGDFDTLAQAAEFLFG